jgi:phospholipid/cholesterol/gamma-HCH transport system substrate-binding protein
MRNSLETRLGIFVALIALAAVLILEMVGGFERFWGGRTYHAMFKNAQELKIGDRVKMAGVEVGRVEDIQLTNNSVKVTMKVGRKGPVKTDSVASIEFTGLLGQNFVALEFGTPNAPIADNDTVLATAERPNLSAIMAKLDNVATGVENLTRSFTGDNISNLLGPFTDFLHANRGPLTAMIANLQRISTQIAEGEGTVGRMIFEDTLYTSTLTTVSNLQFAADEARLTLSDARLTLSDARGIVEQVNAGQGTMGLLLKDETLYRETTAGMVSLKEILEKINQGEGSVGKLVNDQEFYRNMRMTLQKVDKATEGLEDQGPLSVLGMAVNSLF